MACTVATEAKSESDGIDIEYDYFRCGFSFDEL